MAFYDLSKSERINVVAKISANILNEMNTDKSKKKMVSFLTTMLTFENLHI